MKSAQNFRIVREGSENVKSEVFSFKSQFQGVRYPPNHLPGKSKNQVFWSKSHHFTKFSSQINDFRLFSCVKSSQDHLLVPKTNHLTFSECIWVHSNVLDATWSNSARCSRIPGFWRHLGCKIGSGYRHGSGTYTRHRVLKICEQVTLPFSIKTVKSAEPS